MACRECCHPGNIIASSNASLLLGQAGGCCAHIARLIRSLHQSVFLLYGQALRLQIVSGALPLIFTPVQCRHSCRPSGCDNCLPTVTCGKGRRGSRFQRFSGPMIKPLPWATGNEYEACDLPLPGPFLQSLRNPSGPSCKTLCGT